MGDRKSPYYTGRFFGDIIGLEKTLRAVAFLPWTVTAWYALKMIFSAKGKR